MINVEIIEHLESFSAIRSLSAASRALQIFLYSVPRVPLALGVSYPYKILDETPRCSVATLGLPVGDQLVLGEEPGQRRP